MERIQRSCRQGRRVSYKEADESDEDMVVVVEPAANDDVEMQQDGEGADGDDEQPPAQEEVRRFHHSQHQECWSPHHFRLSPFVTVAAWVLGLTGRGGRGGRGRGWCSPLLTISP